MYIPTVPLRGAFYSAGPADRRRIMPAAQMAPSLKNSQKKISKKNNRNFFFFQKKKNPKKNPKKNLGKKFGGENIFFGGFFSEGANCAADITRRRSAGPLAALSKAPRRGTAGIHF